MSDDNPYAAPDSDVMKSSVQNEMILGAPKMMSFGRGWGWIADGFGHFKQNAGAWILTMILGFALIIVISFIPVVGQLVPSLFSYVFIGGLMLGCHAQSRGEEFQVNHLFAGFSKGFGQLLLLGIITLVLTLGIMFAVMGSAYIDMMTAQMDQNSDAVNQLVGSDPLQFLLSMLIALLFLIPLTMAVWFAPALIVVNNVSVIRAMQLSFVGCLKNILPFLLYGIAGLIVTVLALIPLGLGLLVLIPTIYGSIYVGYRDIFLE